MTGHSGPNVSVVIPTRNYGRFIANALDSVLSQEGVREIIVADDGSTDETEAVLLRYGAKLRHLRLQGVGAAAARNAGWRQATGEVVCFLDADDWWLPGKLLAQLDVFRTEPDDALVYCDTHRVDASGRRLELWSDTIPPVWGHVFWEQLAGNRISMSTVAIRRWVLEELGGFDESFEAWEDIELWLRVTSRHPIGYVPRALACYRMHGSGLSTRLVQMALGEVACLEKTAAAMGIEADPRFREALANARLHVGAAHYLLGDMPAARRWLKSAWHTDPRSLRREHSVRTFARTFLGPTLTAHLRRLRHGGVVAGKPSG